MPQLQPADFSPQLIWLAITFVLLYAGLSRLVLPRIEHILGARKARIGGDIEKAREAQAQSEKVMARYEADIAAAKSKAQATLRNAREALDRELSEKRAELDERLAKRSSEAESAIRAMLERAAGELETAAAGVVNDILKQLAGVEASADEVRGALRQIAKE